MEATEIQGEGAPIFGEARAKFFGHIETLPVMIADGTVRVWDTVAGHYTTCHGLSRRSERRIVRELSVSAGRVLRRPQVEREVRG